MTPWGPAAVPSRVLLFDCETDGLLDELKQVHVLVIKDLLTNTTHVYRGEDIADGVYWLQEHTKNGDYIVGHNAIKFDVPALQKVYPWFSPNPAFVWDTLVLARLVYPDLSDVDAGLMNKGTLPRRLYRKQSLESWGYRLKCMKGEYEGDPELVKQRMAAAPEREDFGFHDAHVLVWKDWVAAWKEAYERRWESWNQAMEDYCVQDVEVTDRLWAKLQSKVQAVTAQALENAVARIIARQERHGFCFGTEDAGRLYGELVKVKLEIEAEVMRTFRPRYFKDGPEKTPEKPRRDQEELLGIDYSRPITEWRGKTKTVIGHKFKTYDYAIGATYQKVKLVEFNPGSRDHIAIWLKALYGWEPTEFTNEGKPKVDDEVLATLPYPEAKLFCRYLMLTKRLGQLAEGNEAWLKHEKNGRIHGQMVTNGAVTGRASHSKPNIGQVPAVYSEYGKECRSLFRASPGKVLVGCDMSGIELRCLAHYMAFYDGGEYGRIVTEGDIHTENQRAAGLPTRDNAKTFIYAFLYGAGAEKLGSIVGKGAAAGSKLKAQFLAGLPALSDLIEAVQKKAKRGYLQGLDGRRIPIRHKHAALNTLLQGAGAVLSKMWLALFDEALEKHGLRERAQQVAWVHDEIQVECDPEVAEQVGKLAVWAIEETGRVFEFRVPITGEFKIGHTWADTH